MRRKSVIATAVIGLIALGLAGCGKPAIKAEKKPTAISFAKLANQNKRHVWYETAGKNVSKKSKITYLLVTQNGKVTVYTVNASLGAYNKFTDNHAIASAKRDDKDFFQSKQQAAYEASKAKQIELTEELEKGQVKSSKKRGAINLAIRQLKDRRWQIETARYEKPKPQSYSVKLVKQNGRVKGEQIVYKYHDYEDYLDQFSDADSWLKHDRLGDKASKIKPLSTFFTKTDGAKTVYKHRFHKPQKTIIDKYVGYLEVKQMKGKKLSKMKKADTLKKGNSLLFRVTDQPKAKTVFDKTTSQHVSVK